MLPGGLAIAQAVLEELGLDRLPVSDAALREGLLVDLLGRLSELRLQHLLHYVNSAFSRPCSVKCTASSCTFWDMTDLPNMPYFSNAR